MTKVSEIGNYQIHINSIGWFTVFRTRGDNMNRCGSYETLGEAVAYAERQNDR